MLCIYYSGPFRAGAGITLSYWLELEEALLDESDEAEEVELLDSDEELLAAAESLAGVS